MKTKIEVNGFEIEIQENENGVVEINVTRDGQEVDEMSLDPAEFTDEEGAEGKEAEEGTESEEGVKSFGEFGGEESDLGTEEGGEGAEEGEPEEEEEKVEESTNTDEFKSFQDFIGKK